MVSLQTFYRNLTVEVRQQRPTLAVWWGNSESAATMTVDVPSQISSISNDQIVDGSEWVIKKSID